MQTKYIFIDSMEIAVIKNIILGKTNRASLHHRILIIVVIAILNIRERQVDMREENRTMPV